jgi:TRAP-type mannitol/chloroaromatic compound transport system permease small subunit
MKKRNLIKFLKLIDVISERTGQASSWLILIISVLVLYEIISRGLFNRPTSWTYDVSQFMFAVSSVVLGAYALLNRVHVNMDLIYKRLSPRGKAVLDLCTSTLFFLFCFGLLWFSVRWVATSINIGERLPSGFAPPLWPIKLFLPLGTFLLLLQGIAKFIRDFFIALKGEEL